MTPFEEGLEDQGDQAKAGQEGGGREGADEIVVVVEDLNVQRQGRCQAADGS